MRSVLGPVVTTQLARDAAPHLVEWHNTIRVGNVFDAERAAIMAEYADHGDREGMHAAMEAWASSRRAQGRGARRGGVLG